MEIVTRDSLMATVARRWKERHYTEVANNIYAQGWRDRGRKYPTSYKTDQERYELLLNPEITFEKAKEILPTYRDYIWCYCHECDQDKEAVICISNICDYENDYQVCFECLGKMQLMISQAITTNDEIGG